MFMRPEFIKQHYYDLDYFVLSLKEVVDSDCFVIVSDHGFEEDTGLHSKYGFFSSDVSLTPKPRNITDFYQIIKKVVSNGTNSR